MTSMLHFLLLLPIITLCSPPKCLDDYTPFENTKSCYKVRKPGLIGNAEPTCFIDPWPSEHQASILSIHSHEENEFVAELFRNSSHSSNELFIGMIKGKDWKWQDGSSVNYTNWENGMPVDKKSVAVMDIGNGKWKNILWDRDTKRGFVCKMAMITDNDFLNEM